MFFGLFPMLVIYTVVTDSDPVICLVQTSLVLLTTKFFARLCNIYFLFFEFCKQLHWNVAYCSFSLFLISARRPRLISSKSIIYTPPLWLGTCALC